MARLAGLLDGALAATRDPSEQIRAASLRLITAGLRCQVGLLRFARLGEGRGEEVEKDSHGGE